MDERYLRLASPLKSAGPFIETVQEELLKEESGVLEGTTFKRLAGTPPQRGMQVLRVGSLEIIAGKTTPVLSSNRSPHFSCFLAMLWIGGFTTRDRAAHDEVHAGDIYLNPNYYGTSRIDYLSSLLFALDRERLDRTMRVISGSESTSTLGASVIIKGAKRKRSTIGTGKLWSLIACMDRLHGSAAWRAPRASILPRPG